MLKLKPHKKFPKILFGILCVKAKRNKEFHLSPKIAKKEKNSNITGEDLNYKIILLILTVLIKSSWLKNRFRVFEQNFMLLFKIFLSFE